MAEIANKPFTFGDCFWGFGGSLFVMVVGGFAGKMAVENVQRGPESVGWTTFLFVFCFLAVALGVFVAYVTIAAPLDRTTKLTINMVELIDHRCSPPLVVQLADIRGISLKIAKMNGVPQSEMITLELADYRESIKLHVLGLERDGEEICQLLEGRINKARSGGPHVAGRSRPCPACDGKGRLSRTLADGIGTLESNCEACFGSGLTPGPEQDAWFRDSSAAVDQIFADLTGNKTGGSGGQAAAPPKPRPSLPPGAKRLCTVCNQPSPGEARKCYHCGAEL